MLSDPEEMGTRLGTMDPGFKQTFVRAPARTPPARVSDPLSSRAPTNERPAGRIISPVLPTVVAVALGGQTAAASYQGEAASVPPCFLLEEEGGREGHGHRHLGGIRPVVSNQSPSPQEDLLLLS